MAMFWQHPADLRFELDMMAHSLVRFGDPEEAKRWCEMLTGNTAGLLLK